MQKHKIGDSYIIHKIKPLPEGFVDRSNPIVGNRYANEPLWNIYKDYQIQTYFENYSVASSNSNRTIDGHKGVENSGVSFDGWKILGMDYANTPSDLTKFDTPVATVFSKSGYLTIIVRGISSTSPNYHMYYGIYRTKTPVVNDETDYQYFYDTLGTVDGLTIDDFTFELITEKRKSNSYGIIMSYTDYNGILNFSISNKTETIKWYADDRNGTNLSFRNDVLYHRYNFETGSLFAVLKEDFLAPRSLVKIPSSDPWDAQLNYAFDINNTEELTIYKDFGADYLDCHTLRPVFRCSGIIKEFYTVGFPEVPAFGYRNFEYYKMHESDPIPCYYVDGGLVQNLRKLGQTDSAVFNNIFIRSNSALSDGYSSIAGVETSYPDMNFKVTEQIQKNYNAYDFNGKYLYQMQRRFFADGEQTMYGDYNDTNINSFCMHYHTRKDMTIPIAIPHMFYPESTSYLIDKPFSLSVSGGFRFEGDDSFINAMKQYQTFETSRYYNFIARGYEYLEGGEVIQDLLLKSLQNGYQIGYVSSSSSYHGSSTLYSGMDEEGYHVIAARVSSRQNYNRFLEYLRTETIGSNTAYYYYYRVSSDYTKVKGYSSGTEMINDTRTLSCSNRYVTKNWINRPSYIATLSNMAYNPVKQKDTYTLPQLFPNSGDFKFITKVIED